MSDFLFNLFHACPVEVPNLLLPVRGILHSSVPREPWLLRKKFLLSRAKQLTLTWLGVSVKLWRMQTQVAKSEPRILLGRML